MQARLAFGQKCIDDVHQVSGEVHESALRNFFRYEANPETSAVFSLFPKMLDTGTFLPRS
jgi:hypothetical protein